MTPESVVTGYMYPFSSSAFAISAKLLGLSKNPSSFSSTMRSDAAALFFCSFLNPWAFAMTSFARPTAAALSMVARTLVTSLSLPSIVIIAPDLDLIVALVIEHLEHLSYYCNTIAYYCILGLRLGQAGAASPMFSEGWRGPEPSAASKAGRGTHPTSGGGVSAPVSEPGRYILIHLWSARDQPRANWAGRVRGGSPNARRWL